MKSLLGRKYLETYYPDQFNRNDFLTVFDLINKSIESGKSVFNINSIVKKAKIKLESEIIENAAIFNFLKMVATELFLEHPDGNINIIDIGAGPTIYQHIPLCLHAKCIVHADFLSENKKEVLMYLKNNKRKYVWDAYFYLMKDILKRDKLYQNAISSFSQDKNNKIWLRVKKNKKIIFSETIIPFEKHLKNILLPKNVISCDVFSPTLNFGGNKAMLSALGVFSKKNCKLFSSYFVVESSTGNRRMWKRGMENIVGQMAVGDYFALMAIRNAKWYRSGSQRIPAVPINKSDIMNFFTKRSFTVKIMQVLLGSEKKKYGYDGIVFALAKKI